MATLRPDTFAGSGGACVTGRYRAGALGGGAVASDGTAAGGLGTLTSRLSGGATAEDGTAAGGLAGVQSFASGSDVGSISGQVWTPGRTAGVINAASWATVPTGQWIAYAGTAMSSMEAEINAANLGWAGKYDWAGGVANNYSGMTYDPPNARVWYVAAGGHTGGFGNNGIYRFSMYRGAWEVEQMPSNRSLWSAGYANLGTTGSYTGCPESSTEETAQRSAGTWVALDAAGNAWGNDEVYWDNPAITSGAPGVGRPTARHTYYAASYNPTTDEFYIGSGTPGSGFGTGRRIWIYSRTLQQWTYKRTVGISADGAVNGHVLDEVNATLRIWGVGDGVNSSYTFNLSAKTFNYSGWWPLYSRDAATCRNGRLVVGVEKQLSDYPTRNNYFTLNLDTNVTTTGALQYAGGLSAASFQSSGGQEGQSITYIPSLNRYWCVSSGGVWWQIDPTTAPWTASPLTFSTATPALGSGIPHVYQKLMYVPALSAVLCGLNGLQNMYVYKL